MAPWFDARDRARKTTRRVHLRRGAWILAALALTACGGGGSGTASGDTSMQTGQRHTNRLIHEKSPYLLQHAHNPVDWYPWGPEALKRAVDEDKPIFLSIGYSTCHWCHVMEHESFENETIAAFLNEHFVAIKVDREERPDLDALYMTAVQAMTGSGGWPMSVFLTPDLKPFFAGTYFPPEDRFGHPGFLSVLHRVADVWATDRSALDTQAGRVAEFLRAQSQAAPADSAEAALTPALLDSALAAVRGTFDARLGGFGGAPKFPTPHKLSFLLRMGERTGSPEAAQMAEATLDAMAAGGIHDHLGGGFHRYSTDAEWLVPHFEKMLYDQAGLALAYLAAYQVSGKPEYAMVVRDILDYVLRDLQHPGGGFYAAEDADSEGHEGTFYIWTAAEIDSLLGDGAPAFREAYRVSNTGNWEGKNILNLSTYTRETVERETGARKILFEARERRPRPHRDEKIVTGWNGFMIEAMARAGAALDEPRYVEGAQRAATFVEDHLWKGGRLLRHYTGDGAATVPAYLDDYAYLGRGYLELYEATFDTRWLERAIFLAGEMDRLFARPEGGYRLAGADAESLLAPVVETYDGAMPSGNSVAASLLLRLGHLTADDSMKQRGWDVLRTFASQMSRNPQAHLEMLSALDFALGPNTEIVVAGDGGSPDVVSMLHAVRTRYLPNAVVAFRGGGADDGVVKVIPYLEAQTALDGKPTAYVCRDYACRLPVHNAEGLVKQLVDR